MPANEKPEFIARELEQTTPELKVGSSEHFLAPEIDNASQSEFYSETTSVKEILADPGSIINKHPADEGNLSNRNLSREISQQSDSSDSRALSFNPQKYFFALVLAALFFASTQGVGIEQFRQRVLTETAFIRGAEQPNFADTVYDMAYSYNAHQNPTEASLIAARGIAHLAAAKQDKSHKEALLLAVIAKNQFKSKQFEAGEKTTERVLEALDGSSMNSPEVLPGVLFGLGNTLENQGDFENALKVFDHAALLFPSYPVHRSALALYHVGFDYNKLGQFSKGEEVLNELLESNTLRSSDRPRALRALGISYEGLKQYKRAEEVLIQSFEGLRSFSLANSARFILHSALIFNQFW